MIFLERLVAHHVGSIDDVDIAFAPRGHHLIEVSPETATTLRSALRCALFGDVAPGFGGREDALVGASIVASGSAYAIERRIARDGRFTTSLARGGPSGFVPVTGNERIERELERLLGTDREALAALIWPPRNLEPLAGRLRDMVRAWLGSRRMNVLAASVEVSQDLQEAERLASLHVALAKAAEAHDAAVAEVHQLEYARKRDRAARAVHQLEEAERLVAGAEDDRSRMATLAAGFERHIEWAEHTLALAHLLDHRDAAIGRLQAARARRVEYETQVAELSDLRSELTSSEQRFATLERGLAAYNRADAAATAADQARRASSAVGDDVAALQRAHQELSTSQSKAERLAARAKRARTLSDRANEESHLPTARRLWNEWLHHTGEDDDAEAAKAEAAALHDQLNALETAVRARERDAQLRASWRRVAAVGAVAGLVAGVLGLLAFAPLVPLGLAVGMVGTLAGIWLILADRGNTESKDGLERELDSVARALQQTERRMLATSQTRDARTRLERQLEELGLEIPPDRRRAMVLRNSATTRLRHMADGDSRGDSTELRMEADAAAQAAEDAAREVRRLEARVATMNRSDPEQQLIAAAAERRTQLEKAADARRAAERLADELHVGTSRKDIEASRRNTLRKIQDLQQHLSGGPDLELKRQVTIRDETRANDELAALDAEISKRHETDSERTIDRARAVAIAQFAAVVAQVGSDRAHSAARGAALHGRTVRAASRRHMTDLAAALRALGIDSDTDPTAAEARAAIPDLDAEPGDTEQIRRSLRQARDAARRTETRVQTLELRAGVDHTDIDHADAQDRLDRALRARRVREIGQIMVRDALDTSLASLPAAIERELRIILPAASSGRFWDARCSEGLGLEVWDPQTAAWHAPCELDGPSREQVELATALAFATAGPPLDSADLPAFIWLEQAATDHDGATLQAVAAAASLGRAAQRYPQVIATGRSLAASLGRFDRVIPLTNRRTANLMQSTGGIREVG
ncbi:MAG: hypothetical protein OXR64_00835 [Chloroflexota bacterium]|nr:hypothetical protein [Chloroflexota bacterium]